MKSRYVYRTTRESDPWYPTVCRLQTVLRNASITLPAFETAITGRWGQRAQWFVWAERFLGTNFVIDNYGYTFTNTFTKSESPDADVILNYIANQLAPSKR